jgi:AcrR family transcriptional regulator
MPKKVSFTKEKILKEKGIEEITARNIAKKLNCSPVPIYSSFSSMGELKTDLMNKAKEEFLSYVKKDYTDKVLFNIGIGIVYFAKEEKQLFSSIFFEQNSYKELIQEFNEMIFKDFEKDSRLKDLSSDNKKWLLHKCWIYAHGLATLVTTGYIKEINEKDLKENLEEIADIFIASLEK